MPFVSSLHLYPMKSCRPVDVISFSLDPLGPAGDRRWMVVANNKSRTFLSQRTHPRLALIDVKIIREGTIELSLPNCSAIQATIQQASLSNRQQPYGVAKSSPKMQEMRFLNG